MNAANIGRPEVRARCLPLSRKDHAPASGENSSSGVRWWLIVRPQFEIPRLLPITTAGNISSPLAKRSAPFEPVPNGPTCEHLGPFGSAKPTLLFGDSRRCRVPRGQSGKMPGPANFFVKFSARNNVGEGRSSLRALPLVGTAEIDAPPADRNTTWAWQQEGGRDAIKGRLFLTVTPRRPRRSRVSAIAARP
jgi:hypothetical protein